MPCRSLYLSNRLRRLLRVFAEATLDPRAIDLFSSKVVALNALLGRLWLR